MEPPFHKHIKTEGIIRTLLALFAAHFIVVNGTSYNFFELLVDRSYYIEIAFSFVVALIIVNWISRISIRLDKNYGWEASWLKRLFLQLLFCVFVPVLFEFFFVGAYFRLLLKKSILETSFFYNEFRTVILMICFFNLYCVARYLFFKMQAAESELQMIRSGGEKERGNQPESDSRGILMIHTAIRSIPVKMEDIAYFYRLNGINFARTFDQVMQESYAITEMLKDIEALADPNLFFRINRQMLININSCHSFSQGKGKPLQLVIMPPFVEEGQELPFVVVSVHRVKDFRIWMAR